jgi:hypothetical protein
MHSLSSPSSGRAKPCVLLIHPEGNILANPHLSALVEILTQRGFMVHILTEGRDCVYQFAPWPSATLFPRSVSPLWRNVDIRTRPPPTSGLVGAGRMMLAQMLSSPLPTRLTYSSYLAGYPGRPDFILGVDREGIIKAGQLSRRFDVPYGLVSYELVFESEVGAPYKAPERAACKNVAFAVAPDHLRAAELCTENGIPRSKVLLSPVAGRGYRGGRTRYLHRTLGLPEGSKVVLHVGTIADWTCVKELCGLALNWSEPWVLVVHSRGRRDSVTRALEAEYGHGSRILFTSHPLADQTEFSAMLRSADLGAAFYSPTGTCRFTGRNLEVLGRASGKIATYLQHGVPILVNGRAGLYVSDVVTHNIGYLAGPGFVPPRPESVRRLRPKCARYFRTCLDAGHTTIPVIDAIAGAIACRPVLPIELCQPGG